MYYHRLTSSRVLGGVKYKQAGKLVGLSLFFRLLAIRIIEPSHTLEVARIERSLLSFSSPFQRDADSLGVFVCRLQERPEIPAHQDESRTTMVRCPPFPPVPAAFSWHDP